MIPAGVRRGTPTGRPSCLPALAHFVAALKGTGVCGLHSGHDTPVGGFFPQTPFRDNNREPLNVRMTDYTTGAAICSTLLLIRRCAAAQMVNPTKTLRWAAEFSGPALAYLNCALVAGLSGRAWPRRPSTARSTPVSQAEVPYPPRLDNRLLRKTSRSRLAWR